MQQLYTATLSSFRCKAFSVVDNTKKRAYSELEFSNKVPHFKRDTLLNDFNQALKGRQICAGWFSVLLTKQRSVDAAQGCPIQDVNFIAVYRVNQD